MSIAKMSAMYNSNRCFTVAVDEYENHCMKGRVYQGKKESGFKFENFLELLFYMNEISDQMAYPMRTLELRSFLDGGDLCSDLEVCDKLEAGKRANFYICIKYRYHASWQGEIVWLEQQRGQRFESVVFMMQLMDRALTTGEFKTMAWRAAGICQISVNAYEAGRLTGNVQSAANNYLEEFTGIINLADVISRYTIQKVLGETIGELKENCRIITEETWTAYRAGGNLATFIVKILYEEHSTCQGVICWKESGKKQAFRSFMEMVYLMASALETRGDSWVGGRRLKEGS